jgi:general L-amino acid transport system permease protein
MGRAIAAFVRSCFGSPLNAALSLVVLLLLYEIVPSFLAWAVLDAAWRGASAADCPDRAAACWVFIGARWGQIVYGFYPAAQRWRVDLAVAVALVGIALLLAPRIPRKLPIAILLIAVYPAVAGLLLAGGVLGLPRVATSSWGGLMLTLAVASATIVTSIPLGLLLAIARRSTLPVVSWLAIAVIELWRGVPLIAVLFMAVVMFPLFMPQGVELDTLLRTLIALALFNAATMAEVFRGGFQAIPQSQYEAADSLGLGSWRALGLVILPQVVRIAIPGLVNTCIAILKETTVVLVVGLVDVLAVIQAGASDPAWLVGEHIRDTGYLFVALVFWTICFFMSRHSARLERHLARGVIPVTGAKRLTTLASS